MTTAEAIEICEQWLRHLDAQRERAIEMHRLATLARSGPEGQREAKRLMRQMDSTPRVYDGARLEPAVRHLIAVAPDLLEALKRLLPGLVLDLRYASDDDDKDALQSRVKTVTDAIAKATGSREQGSNG